MEDEDGTCLLDVLCDPQALNDFLHGTNELSSGDLLINSSSGEPPLFTDTPSPASLLADDAPGSGCVDLSFLEEALLSSPALSLGRGGLEAQEHPNVQLQQKEICDILQQSLQEADITEDTLALEAGLGQTAEALQLSLSATSLISLPKDTQTAVEPPQPSLLAVGPGCPSLKPPGTQLMSLLPGNVFPTPPLEATFSINSTQSTSMIIQKSLPTLIGRQMLTPTPSGVMLQKAPQPIQPKLPVNIQPRLVQISPRPSGIAFISANTSQSVFLSSPSAGSKQAQSAQSVSKPVSFNLVGQGSPIVIQSQDPFQGQRQFFQVPASTLTQPTSIPRCLFSTPMSNKPNIVTVRPRQINFSPIFTSPTGQLTLKQGALLPIQSTPPTVFQMPTQIASQVHGQNDAIVQNTVGNQITLINNANMLIPDMTTIPVVNGQSVMQSLPMVPPGQRALAEGAEGKMISNPVLLLPEKIIEDGEQVKKTLKESGLVPPDSAEAPVVKIHSQPSPVSALLQSSPEPLSSQMIAQNHQNQGLMQLPQQYTPLAPQESLAITLLEQMDNQTSTAIGEAEDSLTALTASETLPSLCESEDISMPVYPVAEHSDILPSPIDQLCTVLELTSTPLASDKQDSSISVALNPAPRYQEGSAMSRNASASIEKCQQQLGQTYGLTELNGTTELKFNKYDNELTVPYTMNTGDMISSDQQEEMVHLGPRPQTLEQEIYSALQKKLQTSSIFVGLQDEELTPAQRQQRVRQQLLLDHSAVLNPNTAPFVSEEEVVRRLLPYHTCARVLPSQADFISVDKEFECFSIVLLKRIKDMLNKYRQLLLVESQQESPSAEMVMLERLFLQSERLSLGEDKRRARRDPAEFFLTSQPRISTQNSQVSSVKTALSESPPSPPSWTLQSDRPPGLKTYRSSSKGALRLTIKHESGSGKVIHNSVSDTSNAVGGLKRNYSGQLTKGGAMQGNDQFQSNVEENKSDLNKLKSNLDMETIRTGSIPQNLSDSVPKPDFVAPKKEGLQCSPVLKRNRLTASTTESLVEDGELTEHLQSAIDSILELQRLQGSGAGLKPKNHHPHALEQAISSMLEGQL